MYRIMEKTQMGKIGIFFLKKLLRLNLKSLKKLSVEILCFFLFFSGLAATQMCVFIRFLPPRKYVCIYVDIKEMRTPDVQRPPGGTKVSRGSL